jgi:hypothetical protein
LSGPGDIAKRETANTNEINMSIIAV